MKKSIKKLLVLMLSVAMVIALAACGGGGSSEEASSGSAAEGTLTIFNSKSEIQSDFEALAEQYTEETGVPVEV